MVVIGNDAGDAIEAEVLADVEGHCGGDVLERRRRRRKSIISAERQPQGDRVKCEGEVRRRGRSGMGQLQL